MGMRIANLPLTAKLHDSHGVGMFLHRIKGCISQSTANIESATGRQAEAGAEIKALEKAIEENSAALEEATEMRAKELASFSAEYRMQKCLGLERWNL